MAPSLRAQSDRIAYQSRRLRGACWSKGDEVADMIGAPYGAGAGLAGGAGVGDTALAAFAAADDTAEATADTARCAAVVWPGCVSAALGPFAGSSSPPPSAAISDACATSCSAWMRATPCCALSHCDSATITLT